MSLMHINKVITFHSLNNVLYTNPEQRDNGKIVLIDISASMQHKVSELKLCYSMLQALSDLKLPGIPTPNSRTNLIGLLMDLVREGIGSQEILVMTDGDDNFHEIHEIPTSVSDDGTLTKTDVGAFDHTEEYKERRQTAILDYITNVLKADVHIIGVGNEVKHLLRMAASRPIVVAHVRPRATATEVASVMHSAVRTRPAQCMTEPDARIITIDNLGNHGTASAELVEKVDANASFVSVGGDVWTKEVAMQKFEAAEHLAYADGTAPSDDVIKYNRRVVVELLKLSQTHGLVPGAIVGSKYRSLFVAPSKGEWKINKLLFQLKQNGFLVERKQHNINIVIEGKQYNFKGDRAYSCYSASSLVETLIGSIDADTDFCASVDALKNTTPYKRKSEAGSSNDDTGSAKKQSIVN